LGAAASGKMIPMIPNLGTYKNTKQLYKNAKFITANVSGGDTLVMNFLRAYLDGEDVGDAIGINATYFPNILDAKTFASKEFVKTATLANGISFYVYTVPTGSGYMSSGNLYKFAWQDAFGNYEVISPQGDNTGPCF
jgi:hypothetical protein